MIDNFEQISKLLSWNSEDEFYFVQILRRKKDLPNEIKGSNNSARLIKSYYINSVKHLFSVKDEIIKLCEVFTARAGINLNKRSYKKTALQTARTILDQVSNKEYKHARRAFNTVCGRYSHGDKHWILDIDDTKDISSLMLTYINYHCRPISKSLEESKIYDIIETKSGRHIITKPFDISKFKEKYPDIDIHKNNPTILYIP